MMVQFGLLDQHIECSSRASTRFAGDPSGELGRLSRLSSLPGLLYADGFVRLTCAMARVFTLQDLLASSMIKK
jgi:hypothetical protein